MRARRGVTPQPTTRGGAALVAGGTMTVAGPSFARGSSRASAGATLAPEGSKVVVASEGLGSLGRGGVLSTLGDSAGRKTTIDVTDLIWKRARMAGFSLFAQSPTAIAAAWRDVIPLIVSGSVKPIVERVYPFGEAGGALRLLLEGRAVWKNVFGGWIGREGFF